MYVYMCVYIWIYIARSTPCLAIVDIVHMEVFIYDY